MKFRIGISILVIIVFAGLYALLKPSPGDATQQSDAATAAPQSSDSGSYSGIGK